MIQFSSVNQVLTILSTSNIFFVASNFSLGLRWIFWKVSFLELVWKGILLMSRHRRFLAKLAYFFTFYLRLSIGVHLNSNTLWNPIVEKFELMLAGWKDNLHSSWGKLTFINFVFASLPNYNRYLFCLPIGIKDKLDKIIRKFL